MIWSLLPQKSIQLAKSMNDYWIKFWEESGKKTVDKDPQSQVLRTINRIPIAEEMWGRILQFVLSHLKPTKDDDVLDLFGGNGLFTKEIAKVANSVTIVDISEDLLNGIEAREKGKIIKVHSDVRAFEQPLNNYSKVLAYAGIQYLTKKETVDLFSSIYDSLKPGGICYIGDIPDENKKWNFFNTPERQGVYFENIIKEEPIIGTWFDDTWMEKLAMYTGFKEVSIIQQDQEFPYSYFRYDMVMKK